MGDRAAEKLLLSSLGVGGALLLWHLFAVYTASELILPTPGRTFAELFRIVSSQHFSAQLLATLLRGALVLLIIVLLGLPLGLLSGHYRRVATVLTVPVAAIRSTPVISIILLALIWFPSGGVPVFAAILMGFPILYENVAAGMRSVDREYLEVARAFRLGRSARLRHLYLPAIGGYLGSGMRSASGIVWKVVVAAEVLSQPTFGIGSRLQEARIYLETAGVFAWTALLIVISVLVDYLLRLLGAVPLGRLFSVVPGANGGDPVPAGAKAPAAEVYGGTKRFDGTLVFDGLDVSFAPGARNVILGPSGCGKTTLLRILAGLEPLTGGKAVVDSQGVAGGDGRRAGPFEPRRAYAFQEPRLLPWLTAREHLILVREPGREYRLSPERILELLGLRDVAESRPAALSGGMRQRLGLARALAVEARLLLLDEPFSALDVESRRRLHVALKEELLRPEQTVIAVTHDIRDAVILGNRLYLSTDRPMRFFDVVEVGQGGDPEEMAVEVYRRMVHAL